MLPEFARSGSAPPQPPRLRPQGTGDSPAPPLQYPEGVGVRKGIRTEIRLKKPPGHVLSPNRRFDGEPPPVSPEGRY